MGTARLREDPRVRAALAVAGFAAVTVVTCLVAYPRMFTGFSFWDDEGDLLIGLQGFLRHGSLYGHTFSRYGPFYYEVWGGLFSLLGILVGHDGGRTVTMVVWVLIGLELGLVALRLTGSVLLGLAVQMLVFRALIVLGNEPMHPGGLICLLLGAVLAASSFAWGRASRGALALLGAAVAALLLIKFNIGLFALAAVALACVSGYAGLSRPRWLRTAIEIGFVAIPLSVMHGELSDGWVRQYAFHVSVAALAVVVALRARTPGRRVSEELRWLLAGFGAMTTLVTVAILAAGTDVGGLADGVLLEPLRQVHAFTGPLVLPSRIYAIDVLALGGVVAYRCASGRRERAPRWSAATCSLLQMAVGVAMALSVVTAFGAGGTGGYPLTMLGFCWVALIAPPGDDRRGVGFARLVLAPLAVLQGLHAFPVAGSQIMFSSFLLIPVGAMCVADGGRRLNGALGADLARRAFVACAAIGAVALMLFVVDTTLRAPLRDVSSAYDASVPLGLPGARAVRVGPPEAQVYRLVTRAIRQNCTATLMLPGMSSFYLWARQEPPTGDNATAWPLLFDATRQRQVVAATRSIRGLCLLENVQLLHFWIPGAIPSGLLMRYLQHGFRPIGDFGAFQLLKRNGAGT